MSITSVIIVEDEPKIAQLLVEYIQRENYQVTVLNEGSQAVEIIINHNPSIVILDLMLPGKDGLTICKEVRQSSDVPIIMLTAKVDEIDRLVGLELGADDYICKPFSPREVVARIRTILRRVQQLPREEAENELTYQNITLHLDRYQCEVTGQRIELTPVEFRMLQALMSKPGRVYSRDSLMGISYADNRIVSDRTIDSHVKNLRKKLSLVPGTDDLIHSIYGVGYKIE
tara:strand:- start:17 stop:703 length:687 start_codon:yes stop_codon:yes gene_type:complete